VDEATHHGLLTAMSARTLTEDEIAQRVAAYTGNATGRQLQELTKVTAHFYSQGGNGPVRSAVQALHEDAHRRGVITVSIGRQGRKAD
jgi:hypothetical protein